MDTVLDDLVPLGFDEKAYEAISAGLTFDKNNPGPFYERVEMRLRLLLELHQKTGATDWPEMSKAIAIIDGAEDEDRGRTH